MGKIISYYQQRERTESLSKYDKTQVCNKEKIVQLFFMSGLMNYAIYIY